MQNRTIYLTTKGLEKLEAELNYLCTVKRCEIAESLREAREGGTDPLENTEYFTALQEQAFVEARILEIQHLLAQAQLIEPGQATGVVHLGSTVVLHEDQGALETYTIVGAVEADPSEGFISNESPLGNALLNRKAGDDVTVTAPMGMLRFHIVAVS
jgi:transcription elongation factor GreA